MTGTPTPADPFRPGEDAPETRGAEPLPAAEAPLKQTERPHPLTPLVRGWVVLLAIVFTVGRELIPDGSQEWDLPPLHWILGGIALVCVGAFVLGYLSWRFTRFVIDEDELLIDTGLVFRSSQRIAFPRIQAIDVVQPFAARLFGLAELQIDLGGDSTKLRYLGRDRAYAMRDLLLERASGTRRTPADTPSGPGLLGELTDVRSSDEVLVKVPPQQLLLAALTSGEFLVPLLAVVVAAVCALIFAEWWWVFAIGLPAGGILFGFLSRRVISQFNYTMSRRPAGLRITRGLTSLTSQSLPGRRVQGVRVSQSLLWRRFGLYRIDLEVLGWGAVTSDESAATISTILLPAGTADQVSTALAALWPAASSDGMTLAPAPQRARWRHPFSAPFLRWGHDENFLVTEHGWLVRHRSVVPLARVQSLAIAQGPLSRRFDLADLQVHTAGMTLSVRATGQDRATVASALDPLTELVRRRREIDVADGPQTAPDPLPETVASDAPEELAVPGTWTNPVTPHTVPEEPTARGEGDEGHPNPPTPAS